MDFTNKHLTLVMKVAVAISLFSFFLCSSCIQDRSKELLSETESEYTSDTKDENYLVFPDQKSFVDAINYLNENEGSSLKSLSQLPFTIPDGFKPLSRLSEEMSKSTSIPEHTPKRKGKSIRSTSSSIDALEEMTIDEFNLFKAEELRF